MANTTLIVTTVMKTAKKEKTPNGAKIASRINILDFCEENYDDIFPLMDKIRCDKRREVHTRLDFGEDSRKSQRMRKDSQNLSAKTLSVIEGKVHSNDLATLTRQTRLSPGRTGNTLEMIPIVKVILTNRTLLLAKIDLEAETAPTASKNHMRKRTLEVKVKKGKPTDEEDLAVPWSCKENRRPRGSCEKFSSCSTGKTLGNAYVVSQVQLYPHRDREGMQKKYVKDLVEIHNIKQKDGETIEDFMKRFKIENGGMKGAPECMRISGFMHRVNNPELTKRLNEHVSKTVEEMMTAIAAFIQGETAATSKKKAHTP
nr:reverse transcriptase domain-containing protein [Tanacetum cinerariifolium]